jgi:hypothetical protein
MRESKTSWWPLAMVGLVLVAVLVSGCASCRRCRGGGGGGPGPGPGPGPRSQAGRGFDDDGLPGRLSEGLLGPEGLAGQAPPGSFPLPSFVDQGGDLGPRAPLVGPDGIPLERPPVVSGSLDAPGKESGAAASADRGGVTLRQSRAARPRAEVPFGEL